MLNSHFEVFRSLLLLFEEKCSWSSSHQGNTFTHKRSHTTKSATPLTFLLNSSCKKFSSSPNLQWSEALSNGAPRLSGCEENCVICLVASLIFQQKKPKTSFEEQKTHKWWKNGSCVVCHQGAGDWTKKTHTNNVQKWIHFPCNCLIAFRVSSFKMNRCFLSFWKALIVQRCLLHKQKTTKCLVEQAKQKSFKSLDDRWLALFNEQNVRCLTIYWQSTTYRSEFCTGIKFMYLFISSVCPVVQLVNDGRLKNPQRHSCTRLFRIWGF